ncbi:MAG: enoyl-CoA hydratase/isomerase family protein [Clostridiales bacterium]|nr:enoyl-CoA hydratase/isomerase family protein [Clostridiales bacterium]
MLYDYRSLYVRVSEGVAFVKLGARDGMNPVSGNMKRELADFLGKVQEDARIKAILLTGNGRVFCVGGSRLWDAPPSEGRLHFGGVAGRDLPGMLRRLNKPLIAAVNGYAIGAGMELALACDMVIAAKGAVFYGLDAARDKAKEGGLVSCRMTAADALAAGFVSKVVDDAGLLSEATMLALSIAKGKVVSLDHALRVRGGGVGQGDPAVRSRGSGQQA